MSDMPSPISGRWPVGRPIAAPRRRIALCAPTAVSAAEPCATWRELLYRTFGPAPSRLLDFGCGGGELSFLLFEMGHFVHGVDASADATHRAAARAASLGLPVTFRAAPPDELPHGARSFDGVVARDPFPGSAASGAVLLEWYRVLEPLGTALIVASSKDARPDELLRRAGFVDVELFDEALPRRLDHNPGAAARTPWYRRLVRSRASLRVAVGRRPATR